jgi:hypothetical protein
MSDTGGAAIEDFYLEERLFPPPAGFADQAVVADRSLADQAQRDVEGFWADPRVVDEIRRLSTSQPAED